MLLEQLSENVAFEKVKEKLKSFSVLVSLS